MDLRFDILAPGTLLIAAWLIAGAAAVQVWLRSAPGPTLAAALHAAAPQACALLASWLALFPTPAARTAMLLTVGTGAAAFAIHACRDAAGRALSGGEVLMACVRVAAWVAVLLIVARPVWRWTEVRLERPGLLVVVDDSRSMGIADVPARRGLLSLITSTPPQSRLDAVREALAAASAALDRVRRFYDVRITALSQRGANPAADGPRPSTHLGDLAPTAPQTAIAAALRRATEADPAERLAALLVISDGAETADTPAAVSAAAIAAGERGVALLAVGVAPPAGAAVAVRLDPLDVPARVTVRERVHCVVSGTVAGAATGAPLRAGVRWSDAPAESRALRSAPGGRFEAAFELSPPGAGVHRIAARVAPEAAPDAAAEVHALVEVVEGRTRVLIVDDVPRPETAFLARSLTGDPGVEIQRLLIPRDPGAAAGALSGDSWSGFDVILLGAVPRWRMTPDVLEGLQNAVQQRGVGLLLAGGERLFAQPAFSGGPLEAISPALFGGELTSADAVHPPRPDVTHPAFRLSGDAGADEAAWQACPPLGRCATLKTRPLAAVLARDEAGRAIVAAHEFGAGRVAAAGWDATWTWALHSDESSRLHRTFWRQLIAWLAHRRPRAWVVTDADDYPLAPLRAADRSVRVRAGVSRAATEPGSLTSRATAPTDVPRLTLIAPNGAERDVPLQCDGEQWRAELRPGAAGAYRLRFVSPTPTEGPNAGADPALRAETTFTVLDRDVELQPPTHNVALLQQAALATARLGGAYADLTGFEGLLDGLTRRDPRRQVEVARRLDPVDAARWPWLAAVVALLVCEWVWRKRSGLP